MNGRRGILLEYADWLPVTDRTPRLTLQEGGTPLIRAERLGAELGGIDLRIKYEGLNPTGSFKDRGMVLAVAKAKEAGAEVVICASTGNTSASAAAYAARAGLRCLVVIPGGQIALGKLAQALFYGAEVVAIEGNFDRALEMVREVTARSPEAALVNSLNPYRLDGQQTAAFEVCESLGTAPDILALPIGNAGNITAYWQGFRAFHGAGRISRLPRLWGFQAAGAAPFVAGHPIESPETVATAIRIGKPASWEKAWTALRESQGRVAAVTDEEILEAQRLLAKREGIFVEPASAAPIAGLRRAAAEGWLAGGEVVVCVATGNGLKDPDTAVRMAGSSPLRLPGRAEDLLRLLHPRVPV